MKDDQMESGYAEKKEPVPWGIIKAAWHIFSKNHAETFKFLGISGLLPVLLISPLIILPGLYFTATLLALNRRIQTSGIVAAMSWAHRRYYGPTRVRGDGGAAKGGPAVVVSNHPGLGDFTAIMEAIGRDDARVIVKRRELMRDMDNILERCIVIDESLASRARAVIEAIRHVSAGGLLIVFPAGEIEEDPSLRGSRARQSPLLKPWFPIADGIARRCAKKGLSLVVQPVLVDYVYRVPRPLARFVFASADPAIRSGRAAIATMVSGMLVKRGVRVSFAQPITISPGGSDDDPVESDAITQSARRALIELASADG